MGAARQLKTTRIHDIRILVPHDPRVFKVQVKRDFFLFDQYVLGHKSQDKIARIYQLKAAAGMIYIVRKKLQQSLEKWMREEGCYSEAEIQEWSHPVYEWPDIRITPEQEQTLWEWREKYNIKDRTDWTNGVILTEEEKSKLDEYKQIAILQPRQSGKSEIVVRVNAYVITIAQKFKSAVFAPIEDQAKDFIFQRTRDYIEDHPAYKGRFKVLNALDLEFWGPDYQSAPASGSKFAAGSASPTANIEGDTLDWVILDESQDITEYKVKKSIKFMLAATNGAMIKIGTVNTVKGHFHESTTKKGNRFWFQVIIPPDIVAATRPDWSDFIGKEIEQQGRTSDIIRMSVFLEWLLGIGMFVTEEQWEALQDPDLDWSLHDKTGLQFLLIDVAKSRDETVAMIVKVDQKRVIEGRHPFQILNIMTLHGVDYVSQFHQIKDWAEQNYKPAAVGVDNTGGRGGIADQFKAYGWRVEEFDYTRPSKSEWYTNLSTIINAQFTAYQEGRYHDMLMRVPGSKKAKEEKIFRDFEEQMMDLQKEYINKYLVVHHPAIEGAKDDYADVLMQAAWMASRVMTDMDDVIEAMDDVKDTEATDMGWSEDLFGPKRTGPKPRKSDKMTKPDDDDDDLQILERGANDLEGPKW